ncbi:hypothetical protein HMPREF0973_00701 [Prevotella veroralis F0319]|uniref:Uncharacterized protein n=1 Tax=Prevotella veroralis F0319 TaxID=649761 RepID=C9MM71_9BACT|nr:hypothetical protein HMPREF0973_00701 [Prevotella veroralis F0319]
MLFAWKFGFLCSIIHCYNRLDCSTQAFLLLFFSSVFSYRCTLLNPRSKLQKKLNIGKYNPPKAKRKTDCSLYYKKNSTFASTSD